MRGTTHYLAAILVLGVILMSSSVSAVPDFTKKWQVCDALNITQPIKCDEWWAEFDEEYDKIVVANITVIDDFDVKDDIEWSITDFGEFYNKTETDKRYLKTADKFDSGTLTNYLLKTDFESRISKSWNEGTLNKTARTKLNKLEEKEGMTVGWKITVVFSILLSLLALGAIGRELYYRG